jgi:hypothetical protein
MWWSPVIATSLGKPVPNAAPRRLVRICEVMALGSAAAAKAPTSIGLGVIDGHGQFGSSRREIPVALLHAGCLHRHNDSLTHGVTLRVCGDLSGVRDRSSI